MIGKTFGHYKILDTLGKGGMGVVYKAYDNKLERHVAIKVLNEKVLKKPKAVDRFKKEAKHHAQLIHTNIVTVYGFIEEKDMVGIVMEYVDGESLDKTIYRHGSLKVGDAFFVLKQVLKGLGYAHSKGFVHRDIKPSNIIVNSEGIAKIMDFGISVSLEEESNRKTGVKVGTSYYMSPEQVRGRKVDNKSDIYCLGTTLYEMLTGEPPFYYKDEDEVMRAHIDKDPIPASQVNPSIPQIVDELVIRSMKKKPDDRFVNCEEFHNTADQLDLYLAKVKNELVNGKKDTKRVSKPVSILGTVAIFAVVAGLIYFSFILVDEFFRTNQVDKYREFSLATLFDSEIDFNLLKASNIGVKSNINDICFADEANGYAVGDNGVLLSTSDSGKTWVKEIVDSNTSFKTVLINDIGKLFLGGENSSIYSKPDSGSEFKKAEVKFETTINRLNFLDKDNGIAVGSKGVILRTNDGGNSWIKVNTPSEKLLFDVDFPYQSNIFAVGWQGTLLFSKDSGYKWEVVAPFTKKYIKAIDFMDDKVGIAVCGGGEIYRTNNAGDTWNLISVDVNSPLNDVKFFSGNKCLIVGNKGTLLYSDNWGKDWKIVKSKTFLSLNKIFITKNENIYIAGINGTILKF